MSFGKGLRVGTADRASRRATALLACFAIVLQALAFGWHHHELVFGSRGPPAVAAASAGSELPAAADHECPICFALAHFGIAPVELFAATPPEGAALHQPPPVSATASLARYLLFRSRAPPLS